MLYSAPSLHRQSQGPKQAAKTGNASEEVLKNLHALLQEQAARLGELLKLPFTPGLSLPAALDLALLVV